MKRIGSGWTGRTCGTRETVVSVLSLWSLTGVDTPVLLAVTLVVVVVMMDVGGTSLERGREKLRSDSRLMSNVLG